MAITSGDQHRAIENWNYDTFLLLQYHSDPLTVYITVGWLPPNHSVQGHSVELKGSTHISLNRQCLFVLVSSVTHCTSSMEVFEGHYGYEGFCNRSSVVHEKPRLHRVKQLCSGTTQKTVHSTVKGQPCSKRYDVLSHANNPPVSNFIGEHQQDRWPVNQSLASLSKRRQFRSAGKPPQTNSLPLPPPLAKKKDEKNPSQGMSVTYLAVYKDDQSYQKRCLHV